MALTGEDLERYKGTMLRLVPERGGIGNKGLFSAFASDIAPESVSEEDIWLIRNSLIDEGVLAKGRGRGGSVSRSSAVPVDESPAQKSGRRRGREDGLYAGFSKVIANHWTRAQAMPHALVQITAQAGRKPTGGKWTRPDVTVISVLVYEYIPGKVLEVVTFEIKRKGEYDVTGVFETASHSVFANRSYLVLEVEKTYEESIPPDAAERLKLLCQQFGVGLLAFSDVDDFDTYEEIIEPTRKSPDPAEVNNFIQTQINSSNRSEIAKQVK